MIGVGMIILIIVGLSYFFPAAFHLFEGIKAGKPSEEPESKPIENIGDIIGVSKTKLGQYNDSQKCDRKKKRLVIPPEEMEQVFYTREEARLNIDVDIESSLLHKEQEEEKEEEEDPLLFEDTDLVPVLATGASFDELAEMSEAIQSRLGDLSRAHIVKTAKTIRTVENTDLLGQLVRQVEGGTQKVTDILDRCDEELKTVDHSMPDKSNIEELDLEKYL